MDVSYFNLSFCHVSLQLIFISFRNSNYLLLNMHNISRAFEATIHHLDHVKLAILVPIQSLSMTIIESANRLQISVIRVFPAFKPTIWKTVVQTIDRILIGPVN